MTTTITERPILFSGPMVRAILERRKTQTRRVIKQLLNDEHDRRFRLIDGCVWATLGEGEYNPHTKLSIYGGEARLEDDCLFYTPIRVGLGPRGEGNPLECPYGGPGDRLWVRETWAPYWVDVAEEEGEVVYRASYDPSVAGTARDQGATKLLKLPAVTCREWRRDIEKFEVCGERWRPSIHMPRWASRLTLTVQDVRVERLQDISEADAQAEGMHEFAIPGGSFYGFDPYGTPGPMVSDSASEAFAKLWDSLYAAQGTGWDINPWVWAVTFEVAEAEVSK